MSDEDFVEPDDELDEGPAAQPTVAASGRLSKREIAKRQRLEDAQATAFWHGVMANEVGRREMWKIIASCHIFAPRFGCGPNGFPQPEASFFEAGRQDVGRSIREMLLFREPGLTIDMHREHDPRYAGVPKP